MLKLEEVVTSSITLGCCIFPTYNDQRYWGITMLTDEQVEILMKAGKKTCLDEEIPQLIKLVEEEKWEEASDQILVVLGYIAGVGTLSAVREEVESRFVEKQKKYVEGDD